MSRSQIWSDSASAWVDMTGGTAHTVSTTEPTTPSVGDVWVNPSAAAGSVAIPTWMLHLADRTIDGEAVHADDQEFTGTIGGTAVTPTGTATWTQGRGVLSAVFDTIGASDVAARLYPLTPNSAPVTIEAAFRYFASENGLSLVGPVFTDGTATTSNVVFPYLYWSGSTTLLEVRHGTITDIATNSTSDTLSPFGAISHMYMRLVWTAANTFKIALSPDGVSWSPYGLGSTTKAMTPTHFGIGVGNWGGTEKQIAPFEYLRVTESDLSV